MRGRLALSILGAMGAGFGNPFLVPVRPPSNYGPCSQCGNPCKGGVLCHKCGGKSAIFPASDEGGETESTPQENGSPVEIALGVPHPPE